MHRVGQDAVATSQDVKELYKNGGTQYEKSSDAGEGVSFWNGKKDKAKCKEREDKLLKLGQHHVLSLTPLAVELLTLVGRDGQLCYQYSNQLIRI